MPPARRRRTVAEESDESEEDRRQSTHSRRNAPVSDDSEEDGDGNGDASEGMDVDGEESQEQVVKKLVRYALASEFQRLPIRRAGISEKVIMKQRVPFKRVFDQAQKQLRLKFGMEMIELPVKEKTTTKAKLAAQKTKGGNKSSSSYVLTSTLPAEYRIPDILPPSLIGSSDEEAAYTALCTMMVSIITLSPGRMLPNPRFENYLKKLNADRNMPMDKTENIIKKMIGQGYIVKAVDRSGDEEVIDWLVGPRGKVEIGASGIQGLVREVYGDRAPDDLQQKLNRSLGLEKKELVIAREEEPEAEEEEPEVNGGPSTQRRQSGRVRR